MFSLTATSSHIHQTLIKFDDSFAMQMFDVRLSLPPQLFRSGLIKREIVKTPLAGEGARPGPRMTLLSRDLSPGHS